MKVNSTDLSKALAFLYQAYAIRTTMPIMQNVKLSADQGVLTMTQTNGEQELTYKIPCSDEQEEFTVEMRKFKDRATQYPKDKDVTITCDDAKATVKCGRSKITLNAMPSNEFPDSREPTEFDIVTFKGEDLKRALSSVKNAQGDNDVRAYFNGVNIEFEKGQCDVVATDGHRLHHYKMAISEGQDLQRKCIVPKDSIPPIYKYLDSGDVSIRLSDNSLRISDEESSIQTKLLDARYPDWKRIVPQQNPVAVTVNKADLEQALKGALVASSEKFKGVRLSIANGLAKFESNAPDGSSSEEVIECAMSGADSIEIAFNGSYVIDAVFAVESENVEILIKDGNSSALVKDGNYQAVIMPMRL